MQFVFVQYGNEPVWGNEIDIVRHMKDLFGWAEWPHKLHETVWNLQVNQYAKHDDLSFIITRLS